MTRFAVLVLAAAALCAAAQPALADPHGNDRGREHDRHYYHNNHRSSGFSISFNSAPRYQRSYYRPYYWRQARIYNPPVYVRQVYIYDAPQAYAPQVNIVSNAIAGEAYCREYQATVNVGGQQQHTYGTACLQPDGSWRLIN